MGVSSRAQLLDSLQYLFRHRYSIDARLESRNSFVNNNLISVSGVRLGVSFQRKLKIGFGVSWLRTAGRNFLKTDIQKDFYVPNSTGGTDTLRKFLKLAYFCFYADFVFYKTQRWQLSVPIQLGFGGLWFQQEKKYVFKNRDPKNFLFIYEPGITVQFKIFKWAGVGTDVAYRFALQNSQKTGLKLSSSSLTFKVLFWCDQLYYELFPNSTPAKKFGPASW
jgi:hypothetical protein